jgi:hypothetical protein
MIAIVAASLALILGGLGSTPATATGSSAAIKGQVLAWMDPIDNATVTVFRVDTGKAIASTLADSSGYYTITGLPAVRVTVRATRAGYLEAWASGASTRRQATVYTLRPGQTLEQTWDARMILYLDLTPEAVVTGTVSGYQDVPAGEDPALWQRTPVAGARVTVVSARTGARLGTATSDAGGHFRVGMLPAGPVKVKASAPGFVTAWAPNQPVGTTEQFTAEPYSVVDIGTVSIYETATVYAYVLYHMDPVPGRATVTITDARTGHVVRSVRTDVGGQVRIDNLPWGEYRFRATMPGFLPAEVGPVRAVPGQSLGPDWSAGAVVLELHRKGTLSGSVFGINDSAEAGWDDPLGGVSVTVVSARSGKVLGRATTDSLGWFSVSGLRAGKVKVKVAKAGWLTGWAPGVERRGAATSFTITNDLETYAGQITMYAAAAIEGQTLSSMDPVGRVRVTVFDAATHTAIRSVVSNASGQYRIDGLWPRPVKVKASKTGYVTNWANSFGQLTWDTATVFTLDSGVVLRQTWGDSPSLYLDISRRT